FRHPKRHNLAFEPHLHAAERMHAGRRFLGFEVREARVLPEPEKKIRKALRLARYRPINPFMSKKDRDFDAAVSAGPEQGQPQAGRVFDTDEFVKGATEKGHFIPSVESPGLSSSRPSPLI